MCSYEKHIKMKISLIKKNQTIIFLNWEAWKEIDGCKKQKFSQVFVIFLKSVPLFWAFMFSNGAQAHVQSGFTGTCPYIQ